MKRGFTIIEVMLAATLLLFATMSFLTIYSTTARAEIHSRNRELAVQLGENIIDEVTSHPFGEPPPQEWGQSGGGPKGNLDGGEWVPLSMNNWIEGNKVSTDFHLLWGYQNGSCVGWSNQDWDMVTVVISWSEGTGGRSNDGPPRFAGKYYGSDNAHLIVQVPVWR